MFLQNKNLDQTLVVHTIFQKSMSLRAIGAFCYSLHFSNARKMFQNGLAPIARVNLTLKYWDHLHRHHASFGRLW